MNKNRQIFLHTVIWVALLSVFLLIGGNGKITYKSVVIIYFGVINICIFYINYLFILPEFLNKKKYVWWVVSMAVLVLASGLIKYGVALSFKDLILIRGPKKEYHVSFTDYYIGAVFVSCFFLFLSTALKFMVDWFINEKVKSQLETEKLSAELAFLKSQINPHFLFNSLNNIYSLSYQRSEKTPEAILKLSEIMRYMLYESNDNEVDMATEIRYLENYIELQKLRFKDSAFVQLTISGDAPEQRIMPMVLISFVENAFKHGIANDRQHPIIITIKIETGNLFFQVINKKVNQNKDETGGIGLANVKRRLDLLYKGRYRLHIEDGPAMYTSELYLNL